jgi:hypothetical protein
MPPAPDKPRRPEGAPPDLRFSPPWTDGLSLSRVYVPFLGVGFCDGWYIIRGLGGHITASTRDPDEVLRLIALESAQGFGAVESLAGGGIPCGCHGTASRPVRQLAAARAPKSVLSLEELGL